MDLKTLKVETEGPILTLTVNRPDKLNALSKLVLSEFEQVLAGIRDQAGFEIKGVILTGEGDKAFIAGADIKEMSAMSSAEGEAFGALGQRVTELFESLRIPVIACVNGFALGGGCEMAMACDFIYATEKAVFGQPEVSLGLIPGFGGCVRLQRYVGIGRAKELIYSGRMVKGPEAKDIGLVNALFASKEEMLGGARKTLNEIFSKSPVAVGICKSVIGQTIGCPTDEALAKERSAFKEVFESEDKAIGTVAFLEKRKAEFPGR